MIGAEATGSTGTTGSGRPKLTVTPKEELLASAGTDARTTAAARISKRSFHDGCSLSKVGVGFSGKSISRAVGANYYYCAISDSWRSAP
jgi:hypothetical protein